MQEQRKFNFVIAGASLIIASSIIFEGLGTFAPAQNTPIGSLVIVFGFLIAFMFFLIGLSMIIKTIFKKDFKV